MEVKVRYCFQSGVDAFGLGWFCLGSKMVMKRDSVYLPREY
jgi:hypothetical protein